MADSPTKTKPAAKAARKATATEYQVQRVYDGEVRAAIAVAEHPDKPGEQIAIEVWQDVAVIKTAAGGEKACKMAAAELGGSDKAPKAGSYRAFPIRSDSRLDVQAQQQLVVTYSKPKPAAAAAQTNGGT